MASTTNLPREGVDKKELDQIDRITSTQIEPDDKRQLDAVFGEINENGPNYRNVGWLGTTALMLKISVGLGVLSIPSAFDVLGIVPGTIGLIVVGIITTWCSFEVGVFKLLHPEVYGIDDAGFIMFGKIGRETFAVAFCLCYVFTSGSAMLGISIGLNSISSHGTCTAAFVAIAAIITISLASIQTLGRIQALAWGGVASVLISVLILVIAVGVQDRPAAAPQNGLWESDFKLFKKASFTSATSALSTFVFAYAATPALFPIVAEMRDHREYKKSLILCQSIMTGTYILAGCVVYYFCGSYVASPALGSAGRLLKKVCYGVALPGLFVTATLSLHLSAKYLFVRLLRNSVHLTSNSLIHWGSWLSCTCGLGLIAYITASAIPGFNSLVSLVGALLLTLLAFQPTGCMWLYDNWFEGRKNPTPKWTAMVVWCVFVITVGTFLMIAGTYGAIVEIIDTYRKAGSSGPWTCADNSNST